MDSDTRLEVADLLDRFSSPPSAAAGSFTALAVELAEVTGVDVVLIAAFSPNRLRAVPVGASLMGQALVLEEFELGDTPYAELTSGMPRRFSGADLERYLQPKELRHLSIVDWAGVSVSHRSIPTIGYLAFMHCRPFEKVLPEPILSQVAQQIGRALADYLSRTEPEATTGVQIKDSRGQESGSTAERFRQFFDLSGVGMALISLNGAWLEVNDTLCQMLRRTRADLMTRSWTELTHPEDLAAERRHLASVAANRTEGYSFDKRFFLPDGSMLSTTTTVRCARRSDGKVDHLTVHVQDLTQRRRLEEQLLHSQKLEAVGRLAGGIAHDFNNLLTAILAYTEWTDPSDPMQVEEMRRGVRDAAERAASLTRQLVAFARKQVIEPKLVDLNTVVEGTTHLLRRLVGEDIEVVTGLSPELWPVRVDPGQIEQILINMAVNARDAMPRGGRLLLATCNQPADSADAQIGPGVPVRDYVVLVIADTGTGMDAETQAHLFEPFFTTKDASKGSGLGLATCHGIVSQNGGHIRVTSAPGFGTTFRIALNRHFDVRGTAVSVAPPPTGAGRGETVLLVEDDEMVCRVAARVLRSHGYRVLSASSAPEALKIAGEHTEPIHLLLTDLVMPQMSGQELARAMTPLRGQTRILFTSGYAAAALEQDALEGAQFLAKPYTPRQLAEKVRSVLDGQ